MIKISVNDVVDKLSYITKPTDITFLEDENQHIVKSVVLPFSVYEKFREIIEDEIYLLNNKQALSEDVYEEFLEIEPVVEEI